MILSEEYTGSSLSMTSPVIELVDEPSYWVPGICGMVQVGPVTYTVGSTASDVECDAAKASHRLLEIQPRWSTLRRPPT